MSITLPLFAAALLILVWVAVLGILHTERDSDLEAEVRQNLNLTRSIEEQALRVIATTDQALLRLSTAAAAGPVSPNELIRFANETGLVPDILVQLSLVDATGHFTGSNLDPTGEKSGHVDLSQREHVRIHLDPSHTSNLPPIVDGLFIGKPVLGKVSGRWTVQLSRNVVNSRGDVVGVVVASLDPGYFEDVFRRVDLGPGGSVTLAGSDLTIRARVAGGKAQGIGTTLPANGKTSQAIAKTDGYYTTVSSIDGVERIVAFRKVSKYPLFVLVATGVEDALASWRTTRNVMLSLVALMSIAGAIACAMFVAGVKRLEKTNAALRASEAQAQAANRAKSEFLVAMSHELRTPLTSIRGFAELMEHRLENPQFREQAMLIRKGAEYLNKLFTEILDLAKVDAGAMVLAGASMEVRPFVHEVCDFFRLSADAKQLTLRVEVSPHVPECIVCDELRLKQILSNLLSNAIKFTATGQVTLHVDLQSEELQFSVSDTGPGVPADMHEAIFERFRQGDSKVSYEHGGTGMGLALSRGLAELMGGKLFADTEVTFGAKFVLAIPSSQPC